MRPIARSLCNLESIFGQLYPAMLPARVVTLELAGLGMIIADQRLRTHRQSTPCLHGTFAKSRLGTKIVCFFRARPEVVGKQSEWRD
jgi:hypothetical protein